MRVLQITALIVLPFLGVLVADERRGNGPSSELNTTVHIDNRPSHWPSIRGPGWNGHSADTRLADTNRRMA